MIQKITAYQSSDGQTFDTLEKVQQHEIELILNERQEWKTDLAAEVIVQNAEKVIDILSTKGNSRPATRKANGAVRKKRTPARLTPDYVAAMGPVGPAIKP